MATKTQASKAYEEGRAAAISPTRFCGDRIELPGNTELHMNWIDGFIYYGGSFKEVGEAYLLYLRS